MTDTQRPHALVTGASEGIGRTFAHTLVKQGWNVTAVARNSERLSSLAFEESERSGQLKVLVADLTTREGVASVIETLDQTRISLFINNAGCGLFGAYDNSEWQDLENVLHVNTHALAKLSHAYIRQAQRGDALINVSSIVSFFPMPSSALYAASKAFVSSLSESLWFEGKRRGVYVMNLCPGTTESKFHERAGKQQRYNPLVTQTPDEVVAIALKALRKRRKATIVCGRSNQALAFLTRMLGRGLLIRIMGRANARYL